MAEQQEKRSRGRPATGITPKRNIRVGPVWDQAADLARSDQETMTTVVTRLLEEWVKNRSARQGNTPRSRPPAGYTPYGERKPYTVADSLDDLTGPTSGVVTLPHHIDWSGSPTFNLDDPGVLQSMYETVLAEASTVDDLNRWINRDRLVALWPAMFVPPKVRRLWEARFPELANARVPATAA